MNKQEYLLYGGHTRARGNDLPHAKLNPALVLEIRKNVHGLTAKQWAEKLGLHKNTIDKVRDRRSWSHI